MSIELQTIQYGHAGYKIKLTQKLNIKWDHGHFNWVIENSEGHIVCAGYSTGAAPDKVDDSDVKDIFDRWWRDRT